MPHVFIPSFCRLALRCLVVLCVHSRTTTWYESCIAGEGEAYTKGSFEAVSALCEPSSVPAEAAAAAKAYAARGAYVLALALRLIEHDSIHGDHAALVKMDRDEIEKPGYEFLGLVLFQ